MKTTFLCLGFVGSLTGTNQVFSDEPAAKQPGGTLPGAPLETEAGPSRDRFRISVGWMWRDIGGVDFRSGSQSQHLRLPLVFSRGQHDPMIGSASAYGERIYEDGFVKPDAGTASDGATSNWGYQNSTQVRGEALGFHATGTRHDASAENYFENADDWGFDGSGQAPVVQFDWQHDLGPRWSAGLQTQWSFLSFDGDHRGSNFSSIHRGSDFRLSFTDSYDLHGITPPAAPYQGSGSGNGALLDNLPSSRNRVETQTGSARVDYFNDIRESLDVEVNTISIGASISTRLGPARLQVAAGLAVNVTSWDASHEESLLLSRSGAPATKWKQWHARDNGTDVLPGFYMQGALIAPLTSRITLTSFGRYDWSQALDGMVGPSTFSVDLTGWSVGALIGVTF